MRMLQRKLLFLSATFPRQSDTPVKRLYNATINTLHGLVYGFKTEAALREEIVVLAAAIPVGLFLAPSLAWYVAMIGTLLVLLAVELLNTAIEKLADYVTREQHPDIRRIKDFGSAAVFCALCLAGLVWAAALAVRCGLF
jgi:diacylglycerol kinase (ATP)